MVKQKKKGASGKAVTYLTKNAACKKLQLSLGQFRRFCILKGIYPREVKKHPKGKDKQYFYYKDIVFLMHDPLLEVFRKRSSIKKKIKRAKAKGEKDQVERLKAMLPEFKFDHLIKERYPTFVDALRDLDDALCLVYLFAAMKTTRFLPPTRIQNCERLCREFEAYVVKTHSLRKTFVTIKGIYYQADIFGQKVTWLVPYQFAQHPSEKVDYKVMINFLDFYECLIGFVLYRLYNSIGLTYPPTFEKTREEDGSLDFLLKELEKNQPELKKIQENEDEKAQQLKSLADSRLKSLDTKKLLEMEKQQKEEEQGDAVEEKNETNDGSMELDEEFYKEQAQLEKFKKLFHGKKIFLSREVPRFSLEFVIRALGGEASWEGPDAPFGENEEDITHQIIDRDSQKRQFLSRVYVQPQWVYDSVNEKMLLPTSEYVVGATLPDHLSPFVDDEQEGYKPKRREQLDKIKEALEKGTPYNWGGEDEQEEEEKEEIEEATEEDLEAKYKAELEAELEGKSYEEVQQETKKPKQIGQKRKADEPKIPGPEILLSKKQRKLYNQLTSKEEAKKSRVSKLETKRKKLEGQTKTQEPVGKTKKV